jgi:hypothetical protein
MKTVKEILTENRESVISSIKFVFKVYNQQLIKQKMIEFFNYCNEFPSMVIDADSSKNTKTLLKYMVQKMAARQSQEKKETENLKYFGKKNPKLEDIMAARAEQEEAKGNVWDPVLKEWVKNNK